MQSAGKAFIKTQACKGKSAENKRDGLVQPFFFLVSYIYGQLTKQKGNRKNVYI